MLPTDPKDRKERPITRGVLDYFPDAIAAVANVSFVGNQQHNPGEPMHWAREKSKDHEDCIARHLIGRGTIDVDGVRHTAKLAWRALALLQLEVEAAQRVGDKDPGPPAFDPLDNPGWAEPVRYRGRSMEGNPRVYISGPMRSQLKNGFPAFDEARDRWRQWGWRVFSPADLDRSLGITEDTPPAETADSDQFIDRDIAVLRAMDPKRDVIAMLPGWGYSKGAQAERAFAIWRGMRVFNAETGNKVWP